MSIRCIIADDEELARQRLRDLLAQEQDVEVVAEVGSGAEAVRAIQELKPDLLWLDIRMPCGDGFEVLQRVGDELPAVVFVTAYDRYALRAFDAMALDYLLKPFDRARFDRALMRVRETLAGREVGSLSAQLSELIAQRSSEYPQRMVIKEAGRIEFVDVKSIRWVEAQGNYLRLHTADGSPMIRCTMKQMQSRLDPGRFARIHRSTIVCLPHVQRLHPQGGGDYRVVLDDATELSCSRSYAAALSDRIRDS